MSAQPSFPGPLHPDLFGGETPMRCPLDEPLRRWRVQVIFDLVEPDDEFCLDRLPIPAVHVAARSETEAKNVGIAEAVCLNINADVFGFYVVDVEPLDEPPTADERERWQWAQEGRT